MSNYGNRFKRILIEKDEDMPPPVEMSDKDAMAQTLDKGTAPDDFNVEPVPAGAQATPTMSSVQRKMYDELKGWIGEIEKFVLYLNDTSPESITSKLNAAETDTLFNKISQAETKKIARVAAELSSFVNELKGYSATAHDPKYKYN